MDHFVNDCLVCAGRLGLTAWNKPRMFIEVIAPLSTPHHGVLVLGDLTPIKPYLMAEKG